jgi:hypothetical protein
MCVGSKRRTTAKGNSVFPGFDGNRFGVVLTYPLRPGAIFFVIGRPFVHDGRPVLIPNRSFVVLVGFRT